MKKNKRLSVEKHQNKVGFLLLVPYMIGLIYFFIIPLVKTIYFSFNDVSIRRGGGLEYVAKGLENYKYILLKDANFVKTVGDSLSKLLYTVPIILIFSLFVAILLNQKFKGRMIMRGLFFIPVIIASGVIIVIINRDIFVNDTVDGASQIFQNGAIEDILSRTGLPSQLIDIVSTASSQIFDLTWKSGIQILLFISALQGIPSSYYEAASIEGSGVWDTFWKITFPVISPTSLLVAIYTMIDSFTAENNGVMTSILNRFDNIQYGYASASAIVYFVVIIAIIGAVFGLVAKRIFYNQ